MPKISKVVDLTKVNRRHNEIVFRTSKCDTLHLEIYTGITTEPDATAKLYIKKPNGKIVSQVCTMNDTVATIDVLNSATDIPGVAEGIVKITDSEGEYCAPTFRFAILDSFAHEDSIGIGGTGITAEQAAQIQANKTAIQTINKTIGNKNELPVGDVNIIASINRIDSKPSTGGTGLTPEQEAKLNSIDNKVDKINGKGLSTNDYTTEEKATLSNLKTAVGDTNSGLIKDVKDLKTNGVSQDNINSAIENYLTKHPVQSGATAEQAAQIEANRVAIGDSNGGLIKEINNIKNTELPNLNTAILGVNETLGNKTGLPSGDANVIASINRIDSSFAKTTDLNNKVDKVEGKTLTTNDYTNEEKQTVASLKATVGDTSSGLVKDVTDLKNNGVSQDNINSAIEKYMQDHPVQSGATAEQAAQIEANRTAIGDANSGLTKEVNNIKNTELQNLNTAIQTLETLVGVDETVGDKSGLPSGDANVIASINRIDNKPSGTVTDEQISTAVNNYLTEHPVTGGATEAQAAQIEANRVAIGDENSGLIKEINDIKNASGTFKNIYANNDMPTVFITSDTLTNLTSKGDGKANCEFEIRFKNQIIRCFGTGAVQGNSSTRYPAKNYTFKFYSDKENTTKFNIDVGWGRQSKYCFKKNWVDSTHTRNLSGARIAYDMVNSRPESDFKTNLLNTPHNGSVDGFPTKVYINGEFWGLYTWNIPKDAWMFNMDNNNPNHMVLCAEYNNDGNNTQNNTCEFRATWGGQSDANWSIEVGTYSEALKNSFNNAISHVMNSSDEDFKANFSNYFDLYSILDYYCFSYLTAHIDGLGRNMLMATYDGIHWGACLYDMDSIYGSEWTGNNFKNANIKCPEEYQETNSLLWQRIEKSFSQELHDRYFELRNGALSLGNIVTHVEEIYNLIPDRVFNDDYQKWTSIPAQTSNTITRFRNYMRDRAVYCDKCFKELILDDSVTGVTISGESKVKIGSSITLTATISPDKATNKNVTWSANNLNVTLTPNGLTCNVLGVTAGSSEITCTTEDGGFEASCQVFISSQDLPADGMVTRLEANAASINGTTWTDQFGNNNMTFYNIDDPKTILSNGFLNVGTNNIYLKSEKITGITDAYSAIIAFDFINDQYPVICLTDTWQKNATLPFIEGNSSIKLNKNNVGMYYGHVGVTFDADGNYTIYHHLKTENENRIINSGNVAANVSSEIDNFIITIGKRAWEDFYYPTKIKGIILYNRAITQEEMYTILDYFA